MKSGEVLTDKRWKWYEPEHWRFGDAAGADGKINYMRHATGAWAAGRPAGPCGCAFLWIYSLLGGCVERGGGRRLQACRPAGRQVCDRRA